ncbi:MAG: hypothetical protein LBT71_06305 [Azoarcus sp.]|jgi:hypothetical protein|nr:hypothetical protein [Azoarcus sp.]
MATGGVAGAQVGLENHFCAPGFAFCAAVACPAMPAVALYDVAELDAEFVESRAVGDALVNGLAQVVE